MTGYIRYVTSEREYSKYVRAVFAFQNYDLRYISKRKSGGFYVVKNGNFNSISTIKNMGPEP